MHGCRKEIDGVACITRRLLFDYYREKLRKPCPVRPPRFFLKMPKICAIPTKPLSCRAFQFAGLITPTLKVAGSNPVGRTSSSQAAYRLRRVFSFPCKTHRAPIEAAPRFQLRPAPLGSQLVGRPAGGVSRKREEIDFNRPFQRPPKAMRFRRSWPWIVLLSLARSHQCRP